MVKKGKVVEKEFYVQCGDYKSKQTAETESEAAIHVVKYMMAEGIGISMLMMVSPFGYPDDLEKINKPLTGFLTTRILEGMGEFDHAEGMRDICREKGIAVDVIEKAFGDEPESFKYMREIHRLRKNLESLEARIENLEKGIEEGNSIESEQNTEW